MSNKFPIYLVPVQHSAIMGLSKTYWFVAEETLGKDLAKKDWVLVPTKTGIGTGLVQNDPILITRKEDLKSLKDHLEYIFPLKTVIQKINIPDNTTAPISEEELLWV